MSHQLSFTNKCPNRKYTHQQDRHFNRWGACQLIEKSCPLAAPSSSLDPIKAMSVMEEISENRKEQGIQTEKEKSGNGEKESNLMNQS